MSFRVELLSVPSASSSHGQVAIAEVTAERVESHSHSRRVLSRTDRSLHREFDPYRLADCFPCSPPKFNAGSCQSCGRLHSCCSLGASDEALGAISLRMEIAELMRLRSAESAIADSISRFISAVHRTKAWSGNQFEPTRRNSPADEPSLKPSDLVRRRWARPGSSDSPERPAGHSPYRARLIRPFVPKRLIRLLRTNSELHHGLLRAHNSSSKQN